MDVSNRNITVLKNEMMVKKFALQDTDRQKWSVRTMSQKKVQVKKTLGQQTEDRLMKYILDHQIVIGEKIPNEFELAEMFGVGRSTVREAVKGLVSRGILEVRRGDGTYVISTAYMENDILGFGQIKDRYQLALDLFDVRLMIEPEIVTWACRKATKEQISKLRKLCEEVENLYQQGHNHIQKDIEFHSYLAKISGNMVVERLIPVINISIVTFANLTYRSLMQETLDTHRAIVTSMEHRDAVGAKCAMSMHLIYNRQMMIEILEKKKREAK